jgi:hypothetical protein
MPDRKAPERHPSREDQIHRHECLLFWGIDEDVARFVTIAVI